MAARDPAVDAYIAKAGAWARPLLEHIRSVVHSASPDIEESLKWGFPHFTHHGILCSMAAFSRHCTLGFWKAALVLEGAGPAERAMGQFGRLTSIADLPPDDVLVGCVRTAMRLNEEGVATPRARPRRAAEPELPAELAAALAEDTEAAAAFARMPPSHRREYAEWVAEAKRDATREKRVATTLEWVKQGRSRNWKYEKPRSP